MSHVLEKTPLIREILLEVLARHPSTCLLGLGRPLRRSLSNQFPVTSGQLVVGSQEKTLQGVSLHSSVAG